MLPRFAQSAFFRTALLGAAAALSMAAPTRGDAPAHDYPTAARVEYVQECMSRNGGSLATLYQCSCVIDQMAALLLPILRARPCRIFSELAEVTPDYEGKPEGLFD